MASDNSRVSEAVVAGGVAGGAALAVLSVQMAHLKDAIASLEQAVRQLQERLVISPPAPSSPGVAPILPPAPPEPTPAPAPTPVPVPVPQREAVVWVRYTGKAVVPNQDILAEAFRPSFSGQAMLLIQARDAARLFVVIDQASAAANDGTPMTAGAWYAFDFPMLSGISYNLRLDVQTVASVYGILMPS